MTAHAGKILVTMSRIAAQSICGRSEAWKKAWIKLMRMLAASTVSIFKKRNRRHGAEHASCAGASNTNPLCRARLKPWPAQDSTLKLFAYAQVIVHVVQS